MIIRNTRIITGLLVVSLGINALGVGFLITAGNALKNPRQAVEKRIERAIGSLPPQYRADTQNKYDAFQRQYTPLMDQIREQRDTLVRSLLANPVDTAKAQAEADKLREMTTKLQAGIQSTVIDIAAELPNSEKQKLVSGSRLLNALAQDKSALSTAE